MTQAASVQQCGRFDAAQSPLTCSCPPANMRSGSVWGSSPFTTDSDICTAAQFDGMIEADGGMVTLLAVQGLQSYAGESRNGVTSSAWGQLSKQLCVRLEPALTIRQGVGLRRRITVCANVRV